MARLSPPPTNRTASVVDAAWRQFDDQIARNHRVSRIYSLYVEVPEGIVWELTSENYHPDDRPRTNHRAERTAAPAV